MSEKMAATIKNWNLKIIAAVLAVVMVVTLLGGTGVYSYVNAESKSGLYSDVTAEDPISGVEHYYLAVDGDWDWNEAKEICEAIGGHLATITAQFENAVVAEIIERKNAKSFWLGGYRSESGWNWITGEPFSFTKWEPNRPDDDEVGMVLQILQDDVSPQWGEDYDGYWDDTWTDGDHAAGIKEQGFVCEWDSPEAYECYISQDEDGYIYGFDNHQYQVIKRRLDSYEAAKDYCINKGGHLCVIDSPAEDVAVYSFLRIEDEMNAFLGMYKDSNGKWIDVFGNPIETKYMNWGVGEPNNEYSKEWIIQYYQDYPRGQWNDYSWGKDGNYTFICEWDKEEDHDSNEEAKEKKRYNPKNDAWGFVNGYEGFGYNSEYMIPVERYEQVYGKKYVAAATTGFNPDTQKTTFNSMIDEKWGGNCYGMSATSILFYINQLRWPDYNKLYDNDFSVPNSYFSTQHGNSLLKWEAYSVSDKETPITNLIESYQILNYGVGLQKLGGDYVISNTSIKDIEDFISFDKSDEGTVKVKENGKIIDKNGSKATHISDGKYIQKVLQRIRASEYPLLLNIFYMSGGSVAGHTMVTRTDLVPRQMDNGWWRVYLYDPNHPSYPSSLKDDGYSGRSYYVQDEKDECFIELNPNENKWRYFGSENSSASSTYRGADKDGNIQFLLNPFTSDDGKADNIDFVPEYMYILDISRGDMPVAFDGSDNYWEGADGHTNDTTSIYVAPNSSFELYDTNEALLCTVVDGNVNVKTKGSFAIKTREFEESDISGGGVLTLAENNFLVKNVSGNDISFIDGDSVISIAPNDSVLTAKVAMPSNKVSIKCEKSGTVISQITDLSMNTEDSPSVSEQAVMKAGNEIEYRLENDRITTETEGNPAVNYYIRFGDSQPARQVENLTAKDNNSFEIKDILKNSNGVLKGADGKWAMYKDGKVDTSYTGIAKNKYGWWRIEKGYVDFKADGIYQNNYGWWKTTGGKVTFKETGVFKNDYGWWRVENSKVNFKANGIYQNKYGWWKTTNGKVTFKENGVFKNDYGWWKVKNSKVDFSFTGIASNKYGKWYIKNGKVDFSKNGKVKYNGATYTIKNGKVQ